MNCRAEIDTKALKQNLLNIREKVGETKVMMSVKADAYGHGAIGVLESLETLESKPDYYLVAFLSEALEVQEYTDRKILVTEPFSKNDISLYLEKGSDRIIPVLSSEYDFELWSEVVDTPVRVHVEVNSGMNRLGLRKEVAVEYIERVLLSEKFILDGVYMHFATADEADKDFAQQQLTVFKGIVDAFPRGSLGVVHAANSGAILDLPESYFDMVRPGILLYGYYPSEETSKSVLVQPVMSLVSYVSEVSFVEEGESVGYGIRYQTSEKHSTASIPMGYADGVRRGLSQKISVIIDGKKHRQIGTISMDRMTIYLGDNNVFPDTKVTLIGKDGENEIDFWEWANILDTIPYEVMCGIGKRFKRIYL